MKLRRQSCRGTPRRGSVLVVVLALLAALMLLGFLFFTLASQERENARYFTASEKWYAAQLSPDQLFDFAMEQVIVGPQDDLANSALWGGRYSLLASLVGDDLQPYNGRGANVVDEGLLGGGAVGNGVPYVDFNENNSADDGPQQRQLQLHLGEYAAGLPSGVQNLRDPLGVGFAKPDVGYTYPDLNSPFLAYVGKEPMTGATVVIPSFHRPQYLRGLTAGGAPESAWYTDPATRPYVLRPHADRPVLVYNYGTGRVEVATSGGNPVLRFAGGATGPFFTESYEYKDSNGATVSTTRANPREGFWDWDGSTPDIEYGYEADPDDDGIYDAPYLDLDHPIEETPDGTQKFVPLFAFTIYDLDGLLNLNAHGNLYGELAATVQSMPTGPGGGNPFFFLSQGNEGRQRHEVNPQYGFLDGVPGMTGVPAGSDTTQHQRFFGGTVDSEVELANMEFWFTLVGRGELDASSKPTQIFPGRWGEADRLEAALSPIATVPYAYPLPGAAGSDEAAGVADGNRGLSFRDVVGQVFPPGILFPAPGQPEDVRGSGSFVVSGGAMSGRMPWVELLHSSTDPQAVAIRGLMSQVRVPFYKDLSLPPLPPNGPGGGPAWMYLLNGNLISAVTTGLLTDPPYPIADRGRYVDDPGETLLDPEQARNQITDSIFGPEETAFLHISDNDRTSNSLSSRLLRLVPANFATANDRADRRKRFTTHSADLKAYSMPPNLPGAPRAAWEVDPLTSTSPFPAAETFPPHWFPRVPAPWEGSMAAGDPRRAGMPAANEPLRAELRGLIGSQPNAAAGIGQLKRLTRKLSVNHVAAATVARDGQPRYLLRPLTPHPERHPATGNFLLDGSPVNGPAGATFSSSDFALNTLERASASNDGFLPASIPMIDHDSDPGTAPVPAPALQEWHARRDRQNLARDIYMLLYLLSDPTGVDVRTTNPYTPAQLFEMAQFAVNLVDAMDPDDTITCFVFDADPTISGGGWNIDDDGYSNPVTILLDLDDSVDEDGDGDPTNDLLYHLDTAQQRGMVFGVEAQKLAFGEALAILAKKYDDPDTTSTDATDHGATDWDDSEHRDFTFVELQNMTPGQVLLRGGWSIVASFGDLQPRAVTLNDPGATAIVNPGAIVTVGTAGDAHNTGAPTRSNPSGGRTPWLYSTPDGDLRPSHFAVDLDGSPNPPPPDFADYQQIAPVVPIKPSGSALDFDLVKRDLNSATRHTFRMTTVNAANPARDESAFGGTDEDEVISAAPTVPKGGGWLNLGLRENRDDLAGTVTFHLRRRLNLNRETPAQFYPQIQYTDGDVPVTRPVEDDNPWVIVDTIRVPLAVFEPADDIPTAVQSVKSNERTEPLQDIVRTAPDYTGTPGYQDFNSIGAPAQGGPAMFAVWQRHFDRSFASLADVLMVPLFGPNRATQGAADLPATFGDPRQIAAVNFLFPEADQRPLGPSLVAPQYPIGALAQVQTGGNLWYRLFEFVEVPHKYGDSDNYPWFAHYGGPSPWLSDDAARQPALRERLRLREFGKLNLNTMRHPHALAGLLDDPRVMTFQNQLPPPLGPPLGGYLRSANGEPWPDHGSRDWWRTMLASRDGGYDPFIKSGTLFPPGPDVILPGVPSAKPFRDFGSAPAASTGIASDFQRTFLRTMPSGANLLEEEDAPGRRSLFELGFPGSVLGADVMPGLGPRFSARYRLLGKVLNHATTRSNSYVAFVQTDFFEATDPIDHDGNPDTPRISQIGAKLPDSPGYRGVFVIDRTLALELLKRRDLPPSDARLVYPRGSNYLTYSFAREQGADGRATPSFDWRELILYRKVLQD